MKETDRSPKIFFSELKKEFLKKYVFFFFVFFFLLNDSTSIFKKMLAFISSWKSVCEVRKNEREKEKEKEGVDERVCVYALEQPPS